MGEKLFNYIIGNPPYQEEYEGTSTGKNSIYHYFMDASYSLSDKVMLITPARFLSDAGSTPKDWNQRKLEDPHMKVVWHEQNSANVFPNTDIKGGVAITYRDADKDFGPIGIFTPFPEINTVLPKVINRDDFESFSKIVITSFAYHFTKKLYDEYPELLGRLSKGHDYDLKSNAFDKLPEIFTEDKPNDGYDYIKIFGRFSGKRAYRFVRRDFVNDVINLDKYKVFVPKATGSGALGETLTAPVTGQPAAGHTESFLSIGCFDSQAEAEACLKYIKSKFARTMLGVLKVTQDIPPEKWKYVPLQDFTASSDIDWSKSVGEIDSQLYEKYGLDDEEIRFIETHVKEME